MKFTTALMLVGAATAVVADDSNTLDAALAKDLGGDAPAQNAETPADAPADSPSAHDDGSYAVGPASVKLHYHAPAQYPVIHPTPIYAPFVHPLPVFPYPYMMHPAVAAAHAAAFGAYPYAHPAVAAAHAAAFGAYPYAHPAVTAAHAAAFGAYPYAHPAFGGYPFAGAVHPAVAAAAAGVHPAFNPYMGGFAEESAKITDKADPITDHVNAVNKAVADHVAATNKAYADHVTAVGNAVKAHVDNANAAFQSVQAMYNQAPMDMQYPGAPDAAPGTHPLLGGTMNPHAPLGLPMHPYPFPMHNGLANGPHAPRPYTPTSSYFPGQNAAPYFPGGPTPLSPFAPAYYPGAQNGDMSQMGEQFAGNSAQAQA